MKNTHNRKSESGNVLFLILIAVALFAALSYAVTQSSRSGGGSADKEKSILSGASMTQHPAALRTSVIRMILGGIDVAELKFNAPSAFGAITPEELVFHPSGGGSVFQSAPADVMAGGSAGTWYFNGNFDVPEIGISGAGGNDIVAYLPGVSQGVCREVNRELNFVGDISDCTSTDTVIPDLDASLTEANIADNMDNTYTLPVTDQEDLENANAACTAFKGQPSGCFNDTDSGVYVFYSVILER